MDTTSKTGGPAFPVMPPVDSDGRRAPGYPYPAEGVTVRDFFAVKALPSLIGACVQDSRNGLSYEDHVAKGAYAFADAMLKARAQ